MGPLTPELRAALRRNPNGLDYDVCWTRLSEYLAYVERRGAAQNVASFIGAGTLRAIGAGFADRPATVGELDRMRALVAEEMADDALGIASALIYPPGKLRWHGRTHRAVQGGSRLRWLLCLAHPR